jgi:hypothetical protein
MGGQLSAFRTAMQTVTETYNSPTCRWAVADYKDFEDGGPYANGWRVGGVFTNDVLSTQSAINALTAVGGGDGPEQNLAALSNAANQWQSTLSGRGIAQNCEDEYNTSLSIKRAIVWAGDVSGWENGAKGRPYPTLEGTINSLVSAEVKVVALGSGLGSQASAITSATGGVFLSSGGTQSREILQAICEALSSVDANPLP